MANYEMDFASGGASSADKISCIVDGVQTDVNSALNDINDKTKAPLVGEAFLNNSVLWRKKGNLCLLYLNNFTATNGAKIPEVFNGYPPILPITQVVQVGTGYGSLTINADGTVITYDTQNHGQIYGSLYYITNE